MAERFPSVLQPPIGFAHPKGTGGSSGGTLDTFVTALDAGVTGLASHLHLTADGEAVLHHQAHVGAALRRRALGTLTRAQLPEDVPTLAQLYQRCGWRHHLALVVADRTAAEVAVAVAAEAGDDACGRLWLCSPDWQDAAAWRAGLPAEVHLVALTRLRRIDGGPERRAAALAAAGVDAVSLPEGDWTAGLTTLFHRFGRLAFAADPLPHRRQLDGLLQLGVDAVSSEHPSRLVEALAALSTTGRDR